MNKILVTGADGFIGSHLVEKLVLNGEAVKAFCMYNSNGSYGWIDSLDPEIKNNLELVLGDIRDSNCVHEAARDCNRIYHLAALIAIPYSYTAPQSYIDTNITGTLNVVMAARNLNIEKVIHTSTSETYGTAQFVPIAESHPLVGQSPYAASKIGADQIALSFWRSFGTQISVIRPFNTYGPRQSTRAVIPTIITQIANGLTELNLGNLSPTRDFNFIEDTCQAFIAIEKSSQTIGQTINACSSFEISIRNTVKCIAEIMNADINIKEDQERLRPQNSEVNRLFGDNSLILELTDWRPRYSGIEGFKKGLDKTINWFLKKENLDLYKNIQYHI
jgi:NAD dependent epimerase/dehydratase